MKKKTILFLSCLCLSALFFTGCGNKQNEELEQYKKDMTTFLNDVTDIVGRIEEIDGNSDSSINELLSCLDEMDESFAQMANLEVPAQFANIEELADEASANLSKSVSMYHQAFDNEENFDQQYVDAAKEYYNRAFKRIEYIGTILQGELPEGENVTIITENATEGEPEEPAETE